MLSYNLQADTENATGLDPEAVHILLDAPVDWRHS